MIAVVLFAAWLAAALLVALLVCAGIALADRADPQAALRAQLAEIEAYANRGRV